MDHRMKMSPNFNQMFPEYTIIFSIKVVRYHPLKAQRLIYVPPGSALTNSTFCSRNVRVFMCFVWISEQTAIISLYNINWLIFITEECVYCAVRAGSLCIVQINLCIWSVMFLNTEKLTETFPWTYIVCFSFRHTLALIFRMRSETQIYLHKSYALFLSDCNPNFVVWTNFKSPAYVIFRVNLFRHCQVISCVQTDRCGRTKRFY